MRERSSDGVVPGDLLFRCPLVATRRTTAALTRRRVDSSVVGAQRRLQGGGGITPSKPAHTGGDGAAGARQNVAV